MSKQRKKSSNRGTLADRFSRGFGDATEKIEASFKRFAGNIAEIFGLMLSVIVPKSLLRKVEDASKTQSEKLGKQVGELTDQVEKKFSKGASGFLDVFQNLFAILVPEFIRVRIAKARDAIWIKVKGVAIQVTKGADNLAEKYLPKWLVRSVKLVWRRITKWLQSLSRFFFAWGKSRDYRKLAWSTPGALLAIPLAACVALSPVYSLSQKQQHYNVAYGKALEDQDFDRADLFARKLGQLGYQRMERAEYQEAFSLAEAGKYKDAYLTMTTIAPETEPGYLYGHLWIAGSLRTGDIPDVAEDEAWRRIRIHTAHALQLEPTNRWAKYLEIKVAQRDGNPVIPQMKPLAEDYPEFYGELWVHYVQAGELRDARIAARRFSEYVGRKEERTLSDYMLWASAQEMLGNIKESQRITVEGGTKFKDAPELKQMAAIVLLAELKSLDQNSDQAIDLLRRAHLADPTNTYVIRSLGSRLANDNTYKIRRIVDQLKLDKTLNAEVLLTAGDVHARGARYLDAQEFYLEARDYDPTSGHGYNNIAWIYANVPPVNLEIALGAVNQALAIEPDPEFFETRGQIYFKRGRDDWEKAAADLEKALNGVLPDSDRQNAHASLATIYDAKGEPERAEAHRRQAQSEGPPAHLVHQTLMPPP